MTKVFNQEEWEKSVEVFDVVEFLAELESNNFAGIVISEYELDGIRFHPETNVGEKVLREYYDEILRMLQLGYHSIAIKRGKKGCKPTIIYRLPGGKSIWQELAEKLMNEVINSTAESIRQSVVECGKLANYHRLHGIHG